MTWFGVYREDTGDLVSLGTVVADPLPAGFAVRDLGAARPDLATDEWDPATRAMKRRTRPPEPPGLVHRIIANAKGRRTIPPALEADLRAALAAEGVE